MVLCLVVVCVKVWTAPGSPMWRQPTFSKAFYSGNFDRRFRFGLEVIGDAGEKVKLWHGGTSGTLASAIKRRKPRSHSMKL